MRVWLSQREPPVALVSKCAESDIPPEWMCSRIANVVLRTRLGWAKAFHYYEMQYADARVSRRRDIDGDVPEIAEILFESIGWDGRHALHSPIARRRTWDDLEALVGEQITDRA